MPTDPSTMIDWTQAPQEAVAPRVTRPRPGSPVDPTIIEVRVITHDAEGGAYVAMMMGDDTTPRFQIRFESTALAEAYAEGMRASIEWMTASTLPPRFESATLVEAYAEGMRATIEWLAGLPTRYDPATSVR